MIFRPAPLSGVWVIEPEKLADERGFFARTFCRDEMAAHGLPPGLAQASVSFNRRAGTLRGMHWLAPPRREGKLVRCTRGAIFDAVVDLRRGSPTVGGWFGVELAATGHRQLWVPPGFAHGFQTLEDASEVLYLMSESYSPGHDRGFRFDDPGVGIRWPLEPTVVSERDRGLPPFAERGLGGGPGGGETR